MWLKVALIICSFCFLNIESQEIEKCNGLKFTGDFPFVEDNGKVTSVNVKLNKNGQKSSIQETMYSPPDSNSNLRRGSLTLINGIETSVFAYFFDTEEYFETKGYTCTTSNITEDNEPLIKTAKLFIPETVVNSQKDLFLQHFGPLSILRQALVNKKKVANVADGQWRQCVSDKLSIDYNFKKGPVIANSITIKSKVGAGVETWTYLFEVNDNKDDANHAPIGYGCTRIDQSRPTSFMPLSFQTQIVLQDVDVSTGEENVLDSEEVKLVVHDNIMAITGKSADGEREERNVIDDAGSLVYINADDDKCKIESLYDAIERTMKIPYTTKEKANLLSPTITNVDDPEDEKSPFQYLGTSDHDEFLVYERVIDDFYNDGTNVVAIVMHYKTNELRKGRGEEQKSGNTRKINIIVFDSNKRTKITKRIYMQYQGFSTDLDDAVKSFNTLNCFPDEAVTTFRITFTSSIAVSTFKRRKPEIIQSFIDSVSDLVSVVRIPRVDLQPSPSSGRTLTGFVLEADLLERPQSELFYEKSEGLSFTSGLVVEGIHSQSACASSCLDDKTCNGFAMCKSTCYKSEKTAMTSTADCNAFTQNGVYKKSVELAKTLKRKVKEGNLKMNIPGLPDFVATDFFYNSKNSEDNFPDFENMIPNQNAFSAHVEKIDLKNKESTFFYEVRDIDLRRGELRRVTEDMSVVEKFDQRFIHYYDTNEYFSINGFVCETKSMNDTAEIIKSEGIIPDVLVDAMVTTGVQIVGPSILLDFGRELAFGDTVAFETTDYNGFSGVKKWTTEDEDRGYKLDYYFYKADFGLSPIAVEVFLQGNPRFIYNFAEFKPLANFHVLKSLPVGTACTRLHNSDAPTPTFIPQYTQTLELVEYKVGDNRSDKIETLVNAVYTNFSLSVIIPRNYSLVNEVHPIRNVIDEENNIIYITDLFTGGCQIKRKPDFNYLQWPYNADFNALDLRFYVIDDSFQYIGDTEERGMAVKIFEKLIKDAAYTDDGTPMPAVVTHYIQDDDQFSIPMKVIVRIFKDVERKTLQTYFSVNVHDFKELSGTDRKEQIFDISNCFLSPDQHTWFQLQFIDDFDTLAFLPKKRAIEVAFRNSMEEDFGIPPSRLPKVIVDVTSSGVFITAKLLERAPFQYGFTKKEKKRMTQTFGKEIVISSEDKCGNLCYEDQTCVGFSYCSNYVCARLYKDANVTVDNNLEDGENCNAYTKLRPDADVGSGDSMSDTLLFMLQEEVINKMFTLKIVDVFDEKLKIVLTASELKQNVEPGFSREFEERIHSSFVSKQSAFDVSKSISKSYSVKKINRRFDFTKLGQFKRKVAEVDISVCKQFCDDDAECKSFSYCTSQPTECILSSLEGEAIVNDITITSQSCTLLSKSFSAEYEKREGWQVTSAKVASVLVPSVEECARKCSTRNDFKCLSFDVCMDGRQMSCYLHTYHLFVDKKEAPISVKTDCDHYSKKFTYQFTAVANQKFKDVKPIESIKHVSVEGCAHSCVSNGDCKSFEFCESADGSEVDNNCRITSTTAEATNLILDPTCKVYNKAMLELASSDTKRYSKGLGAFLSILLFVVGSSLGVVIVWLIYNKFVNLS